MSKHCAKQKPKIMSDITFNKLFFNNDESCTNFFINLFYPLGFVCPDCGCRHFTKIKTRATAYSCSKCSHQIHLFSGTAFQDNKLPLYTLLYGIFLFVTAKKSISAQELASKLGVNRKTAQLLCRKLRKLMEIDNNCFDLNNSFYELDGIYIGGKSSNGKRGLGTEKQPFLVCLSTDTFNNYPDRIKINQIESENKEEVQKMLESLKYNTKTTISTDKNQCYDFLNKKLKLINKIIDYNDKNHNQYWLNIIVSNIKSNIIGIFHGIGKRYLNRYVQEYAWRFNHRYKGEKLMFSVSRILSYKIIMTRKMLRDNTVFI